ncbi:MAG: NlpC/P60 family protein [Faecalibacillus sp.]
MKKILLSIMCFTLIFTLFGKIQDSQAIDFEGQESKYMKLCSSSLSSNESTCREFNNYLKKKNSQLKKEISNSKNQIDETQTNLKKIASQITSLNDEIAKKEQEITYLENSIKQLEADIEKRDDEIKIRMYAMQSYNNSNSYVEYVFGASSFSDFFSRIESLNEITEYDEDLIKKLVDERKQVEQQKATVQTAKVNVENQKKQQVALQEHYESLFAAQNANLLKQQQEQKSTANAQGQLDAALSALVDETESTSKGVTGDSELGQKIAQKALSKQGCMYLWGACHSMSEISNPATNRFDCSGLVSWAHYQAGCNIGSNTTSTLLGKGISITSSQLQAGDIILFKNSSGNVSHVGIAINNSQMVHAPQTGKPVQVANLTSGWRARVISYRRLY